MLSTVGATLIKPLFVNVIPAPGTPPSELYVQFTVPLFTMLRLRPRLPLAKVAVARPFRLSWPAPAIPPPLQSSVPVIVRFPGPVTSPPDCVQANTDCDALSVSVPPDTVTGPLGANATSNDVEFVPLNVHAPFPATEDPAVYENVPPLCVSVAPGETVIAALIVPPAPSRSVPAEMVIGTVLSNAHPSNEVWNVPVFVNVP
jgi:hypothetical protein